MFREVASLGQERNARKVLVGMIPLGRYARRRKDFYFMGCDETEYNLCVGQ
jgi:hypothetical protein